MKIHLRNVWNGSLVPIEVCFMQHVVPVLWECVLVHVLLLICIVWNTHLRIHFCFLWKNQKS